MNIISSINYNNQVSKTGINFIFLRISLTFWIGTIRRKPFIFAIRFRFLVIAKLINYCHVIDGSINYFITKNQKKKTFTLQTFPNLKKKTI